MELCLIFFYVNNLKELRLVLRPFKAEQSRANSSLNISLALNENLTVSNGLKLSAQNYTKI